MPAELFNYLLADGKPYSCSRVLSIIMQALENYKYPVCKFLFNAYAVIAYRNYPFITGMARCYINNGRFGSPEFNCVADKILQQLVHMQRVGYYSRQPFGY